MIMYARHFCSTSSFLLSRRNFCVRGFHLSSRWLNISEKYQAKVQKAALERGLSVEELRQKALNSSKKNAPLPEAQRLQERVKGVQTGEANSSEPTKVWSNNERKDKSPVKPLQDFMDVHRIFRTPHTAEQVSTLWTAFHASRSSGTGRGYLSASVPTSTYETLTLTAKSSPSFIIPLMRSNEAEAGKEGADAQPAYEFFFMQWSFHGPSLPPSSGPLQDPLPSGINISDLPVTTILFTPLLEYKTRSTFATPHLVLTFYPDFSSSHGVVLLRGELTPSQGGGGRYLLSQQDSQMLALGMQRFYLADESAQDINLDQNAKKRAELLRAFNSQPGDFSWEELLKLADPTI